MAENCKDCRDGILNKQASLFADPACTDCNNTEVVCTGKQTYSDCVAVNTTLNCLGTENGDSLTEVLLAICEISAQTNTCKVKIDEDDTCCGYLKDKITSDTLNISVSREDRGCKTLQIEEKDWEWSNLTLKNKWVNFNAVNNSYAVSKYGVKNNEVKLSGSIFLNTSGQIGEVVVATLPLSVAPTSEKLYSFTGTNAFLNYNQIILSVIRVKTNGDITVVLKSILGNSVSQSLVSFDHISWNI